MRTHALRFPVKTMCRVLCVARSGFYAWCSRRTSTRHQRRAELDRQVAQAYSARKGRSGAPRLCHDLWDAGLPCNRKTVSASMQRQGLRARAARKFKAATNSRHSLPVAENLLKQDFTALAPNQKWGGRHHLPAHRGRLAVSGGGHRRVYVQPITGKRIEIKGANHAQLKAWKAEFGTEMVEGWRQA